MKYILLLVCFVYGYNGMAQSKPEVYIFLAEKCPISIYMVNPLQQVLTKHNSTTNFFAVFPMRNSSLETATAFLSEQNLDALVPILDTDQSIARKYNAKITPEVIVVMNDEIKYRGRISDAYRAPGKMKHGRRSNDLLTVLDALELDSNSTFENQKAVGCFITFHQAVK